MVSAPALPPAHDPSGKTHPAQIASETTAAAATRDMKADAGRWDHPREGGLPGPQRTGRRPRLARQV